jgi:hypothetical protein
MSDHIFNSNLQSAAADTNTKLVQELFLLDATIADWSEQLNRAQPLLSGRVVIAFTPGSDISVNGVRQYLVEPTPAKMIRLRNGTWKKVWLTKSQNAKSIVELRVGKGLPSDRVVVRLLQGIEDLLAQRERVFGVIMEFRRQAMYALNASKNARARHDVALDKYKARITTDWSVDAPQALLQLKKKHHDNYIRKKAKKMADAIMAEAALKGDLETDDGVEDPEDSDNTAASTAATGAQRS